MTTTRIHRTAARAALAAALLCAAAAPLPAAAGKDRFEPFLATATISEQLVPSNDPACQPAPGGLGTTALGLISGSGLASEVGAFTVQAVDCVRSANPYFLPPFNFSSSSFKLVARNGDQIVVQYSGTATLSAAGPLLLNGTFSFVSGTGRFRGVKGGGSLTGVENILTAPATGFVTFSGRISE